MAALAVLALASACGSDGGTEPVVLTVAGTVTDDFTGAAVEGVNVAVEGAPTLTATTAAGGTYSIANVPATESLLLSTSKANFRTTRNVVRSATTGPVTADLTIVAVADVQRQYTAVGLTPTTGMGVVFIDLVDGTGAPRTGIPAASITLVDATLSPAGVGPYFFGAAGDVVPQVDLSQSAAFGGRARAAFLNVPVGSYTLRVASGTPTLLAPVIVSASGATLITR